MAMSEQSIIYVVKMGIRKLDDILWKVGKASTDTLGQRIQYAYDTVKSSEKVYGEVFWTTVDSNGHFHESAMQTAFSKTFVPVQTPNAGITEFYTPYYRTERGGDTMKRPYYNDRISDALELLKASNYGSCDYLGWYISTIIGSSSVMAKHHDIPAYCLRDKRSIEVCICDNAFDDPESLDDF